MLTLPLLVWWGLGSAATEPLPPPDLSPAVWIQPGAKMTTLHCMEQFCSDKDGPDGT